MKPVIIIAIAFVLLIPTSIFAQESLSCPSGAYHGLDNLGNDACRDIKTNKIVQGVTTQNNQNKPQEQTDPCVNPLAPGCISVPLQNFEETAVIFGIIGTILVLILVVSKTKRKEHKEKVVTEEVVTEDSTHY